VAESVAFIPSATPYSHLFPQAGILWEAYRNVGPNPNRNPNYDCPWLWRPWLAK